MSPRTPRKTQSALKNAIFITLVVFSNTIGNLLLAVGMTHMPDIMAVPFSSYLCAAVVNVFLAVGTVLLIVSMLAQLSLYSWADLSYVLPVTASGYVVTALLSKFFLQEHVSVSRWVGVIVISVGVFFVAETPSDTKHAGSHNQ